MEDGGDSPITVEFNNSPNIFGCITSIQNYDLGKCYDGDNNPFAWSYIRYSEWDPEYFEIVQMNLLTNCTDISISNYQNVTNMVNLFTGIYNLTNITTNIDMSNVINAAYMFSNTPKLFNVSIYNTQNIQNAYYMFHITRIKFDK